MIPVAQGYRRSGSAGDVLSAFHQQLQCIVQIALRYFCQGLALIAFRESNGFLRLRWDSFRFTVDQRNRNRLWLFLPRTDRETVHDECLPKAGATRPWREFL